MYSNIHRLTLFNITFRAEIYCVRNCKRCTNRRESDWSSRPGQRNESGAVGKPNFNIPLIYFKEPQNERNYYLFFTTASYGWPYSILSDEYLESYVNGLDVCKGVSPDYWVTNYPYDFMRNYFIEMHSVTKEGYEYYKALIQQFRNDGGGYSPSPASPPTNLDNGALGLFRASAVNRVEFTQDNDGQWRW